MSKRELTLAEWAIEGALKFGPDRNHWKFTCPSCKRVASTLDWHRHKQRGNAAFLCVSRFDNKTDCKYHGGGLFKLNPVRVTVDTGRTYDLFEFAEPDPAPLTISEVPC